MKFIQNYKLRAWNDTNKVIQVPLDQTSSIAIVYLYYSVEFVESPPVGVM